MEKMRLRGVMRIFWMAGLCAWLGVVGSLSTRGDIVEMNDGTVRKGTVVRKTDDEVFLRIDREGIKATVGLPAQSVVRIIKEPEEIAATAPAPVATPVPDATPTPAPTLTPPPPPPPAVKQPPRAEPPTPRPARKTPPMMTELPPTKGFLLELAASAIGQGPDDPRRLPPELKDLWDDAMRQATAGKPADLLESLRTLDDAFMPIAGGMDRLEAICRRERNVSFGPWMAQVHWDTVADNYAGGRFDFGDIHEAERKPLIGMLKEKTAPALDPLRSYFPPIDPKTGKPEAFKQSQLQGISTSNAIDIRKKAAYASAILFAQLKLEPEMPTVDKLFIGNQLTTVRRILGRAMELEPAAKAELDKAAAAERARKK